jgi:hypothetical protein
MTAFKKYTEFELMYLAKFYEHDGMDLMAEVLERKPKTVAKKYTYLRDNGQLEHYRSLWDREDVNALERR